jgi:hypothetical protein
MAARIASYFIATPACRFNYFNRNTLGEAMNNRFFLFILTAAAASWLFNTACFAQQAVYHPNPASLAAGMNPLAMKYQDYDTDGDGIADYRIVGDVNGNGRLEWDDIQIALDGLCDRNGDSKQDVKDGKLKDLDGDGFADDPFCGTLHILPGTWVSRQTLDPNIYNKKDDQILLGNYQGLWFKGSGVDKTILKTIYSRQSFCRAHQETGCGGVCSRESAGFLTVSDFTFEGLDGRTWGKMDCDGDGLDAGHAMETDYKVRTLQTAITVFSTAPRVAKEVKVFNVKVTKADYNGFALGEINNLFLSNLSVHDAGGAGILMSGIQNGFAENLFVENVDGVISDGAISIFSNRDSNGRVQSQPTKNLTLDNVTSQHNHTGLALVANGAGGISNVTIRNFNVFESRDSTRSTSPYAQNGIRLNDFNCIWSKDSDGLINDPCFITNVTLENGSVIGCPGYSLTFVPSLNGPPRNLTVRGVYFEGNGYGNGGVDSRDVNLAKWPGVVFDGNTIVGVDYNGDGQPDLSHLIRVDSEGLILRNNEIYGIVGYSKKLIRTSESNNIAIYNNNFSCLNVDDCIAIGLDAITSDIEIQGNIITLKKGNGIGVSAAGTGHRIVGNFFRGGQQSILTWGTPVIMQSNMKLD